jgi:hypothetical protein
MEDGAEYGTWGMEYYTHPDRDYYHPEDYEYNARYVQIFINISCFI